MKAEFTAALISFIIVAVMGTLTIPTLARLKFGQTVRTDGPKRHFKKMGTPTMGGIMFIPAIAISTLIISGGSANVLMAILSMTGFAMIGFFDDYIKIIKKRSLGLRANQKLMFQLILSMTMTFYAYKFFPKTGTVLAPFFPGGIETGLLFIPFTIFVILGTVNSVNLTDGLDGLVSGIVAIISFFYTLICLFLGLKDLAIFAASIGGACIGFLIYNHYPARVFMGDTGALGLGGALAAMAVLSGTQFYLIFFGMIFIIETLSVILQVIFFRVTGRRIFKMSPIHHHFELMGWSEQKVVLAFWCFTLLTGVMGLALFDLTGLP